MVEDWHSQSKRGCNESARHGGRPGWRLRLEEPDTKVRGEIIDDDVAKAEVDNVTAGGFFQCFGREQEPGRSIPRLSFLLSACTLQGFSAAAALACGEVGASVWYGGVNIGTEV